MWSRFDYLGVLPLGSKQALSNGKEPEEVTDLVAAFEQHNRCRITLSCSLALHGGYLDLEWRAAAFEMTPHDQVVTGLALASVTAWAGAYKTLKGVLTFLLYQLDFALAREEFDKATIK
jgi:hypothetical protein